jgi:hypothetical protein
MVPAKKWDSQKYRCKREPDEPQLLIVSMIPYISSPQNPCDIPKKHKVFEELV